MDGVWPILCSAALILGPSELARIAIGLRDEVVAGAKKLGIAAEAALEHLLAFLVLCNCMLYPGPYLVHLLIKCLLSGGDVHSTKQGLEVGDEIRDALVRDVAVAELVVESGVLVGGHGPDNAVWGGAEMGACEVNHIAEKIYGDVELVYHGVILLWHKEQRPCECIHRRPDYLREAIANECDVIRGELVVVVERKAVIPIDLLKVSLAAVSQPELGTDRV